MLDKNVTGTIFNVQKFSVHDGKGIRTLVFLKGCPLKCTWCANPESQSINPEKARNPNRCISVEKCGRCINACERHNISFENNEVHFNKENCIDCKACAKACPSGARNIYGEEMSVDKILNRVEEDGVFYARSGGGLTLSGGEPTMQKEFCLAILREAKKRHLHTAMETCAYTPWETFKEVGGLVNELFMDIKSLNSKKHKEYVGVDNSLILENFKKLYETYPKLPIHIRTPIIPSFNDSIEDIKAICDFLPRSENLSYELLPFHKMGQPKYEYIGKTYDFADAVLDQELMEELKAYAENAMKN